MLTLEKKERLDSTIHDLVLYKYIFQQRRANNLAVSLLPNFYSKLNNASALCSLLFENAKNSSPLLALFPFFTILLCFMMIGPLFFLFTFLHLLSANRQVYANSRESCCARVYFYYSATYRKASMLQPYTWDETMRYKTDEKNKQFALIYSLRVESFNRLINCSCHMMTIMKVEDLERECSSSKGTMMRSC